MCGKKSLFFKIVAFVLNAFIIYFSSRCSFFKKTKKQIALSGGLFFSGVHLEFKNPKVNFGSFNNGENYFCKDRYFL